LTNVCPWGVRRLVIFLKHSALRYNGLSSVIHILDDFSFIEAKCQVDLDNFLCVCRRIGVPIADEKTMGPTNALQFAGITLDTVLMEARLPEDRLAKCRTQLADFCSRKSVTLKEL